MVDVLAIKAEMVRNGYTNKKLAKEMKISEQTLMRRFKNGDFNLDEAQVIISCLNIENPLKYFFASSVTCQVTN